ncbi:S8 family serine peptidase [Neolewinella xylanilytica]|uniref:S8 family serine peptidase n=1 Tax=Neolewinella xylanilytica TaxID=1514080 RepID=UPI001472B1ED|nr:S8 family serine peptidase [Neolewinella xylanilytica]
MKVAIKPKSDDFFPRYPPVTTKSSRYFNTVQRKIGFDVREFSKGNIAYVVQDWQGEVASEIDFVPWLAVQFKDSTSRSRIESVFSELEIDTRNVRELDFAKNLYEIHTPEGGCAALQLANTISEAPEYREFIQFAEPQFRQLSVKLPPHSILKTKDKARDIVLYRNAHKNFRYSLNGASAAAASAAFLPRKPKENELTIAVVDQFFGSREQLREASVVHSVYYDDNYQPRAFDDFYISSENHGTRCACIVNKLHPTGHIALLSMASKNNLGTQASLAKCIAKTVAADADPILPDVGVISCSLGSASGGHVPMQSILKLAIDHAVSNGRGGKGIPVIWAAQKAQEGVPFDQDEINNYHKVITVGSVKAEGTAFDTKEGQHLDVMAPPIYLSPFGCLLASSFAAPQAAAMAGYLIERYPEITAAQIHAMLRMGTRPPNTNDFTPGRHHPAYGYGILDFDRIKSLSRTDLDVETMLTTLKREEERWNDQEKRRLDSFG